MADQMIGTIAKILDRGAASSSRPTVKIAVGHGRPNVGIFRRLACPTALIAGYSSAYATRNHPIGVHAVRDHLNDRRPLITPTQKRSAACRRKGPANNQAAGLMRVKNTTWYATADHAQCTAKRPQIQRSCERRDDSSHTPARADATQSATTAGHDAPL